MKRVSLLILGLVLASCGMRQPAISKIGADSVSVQADVYLFASAAEQAERMQWIQAEARRGCALYNRNVSHPISKRCSLTKVGDLEGCFVEEFLFACTPAN